MQPDVGGLERKWMLMKQVCAYLSVSRETAIKWIKNRNARASD